MRGLQDRLCSASHEAPEDRPGLLVSVVVGALAGAALAALLLVGGGW